MMKRFGRRTGGAASSTVAICTAMVFVLSAAAVSLMIDQGVGPIAFGGGWSLRGAIGPSDVPPVVPRHANSSNSSGFA